MEVESREEDVLLREALGNCGRAGIVARMKLMALVHIVEVMVVGHCVGVMTEVDVVVPEGVKVMVLVLL